MRLINLKQIQAEKVARSRSWIFTRIAAGKFPAALPNTVPSLWEEQAVDRAVTAFADECRKLEGERPGARRIKVAADAKAAKAALEAA